MHTDRQGVQSGKTPEGALPRVRTVRRRRDRFRFARFGGRTHHRHGSRPHKTRHRRVQRQSERQTGASRRDKIVRILRGLLFLRSRDRRQARQDRRGRSQERACGERLPRGVRRKADRRALQKRFQRRRDRKAHRSRGRLGLLRDDPPRERTRRRRIRSRLRPVARQRTGVLHRSGVRDREHRVRRNGRRRRQIRRTYRQVSGRERSRRRFLDRIRTYLLDPQGGGPPREREEKSRGLLRRRRGR